jgi:hypothetical protein
MLAGSPNDAGRFALLVSSSPLLFSEALQFPLTTIFLTAQQFGPFTHIDS